MTGLRRVAWLPPAALAAALAAALVIAVVLARREQPSPGLRAATPGIVSASPGAAPEIRALNAQLAQIAALRAATTYGAGLAHVVRAPIASLRPLLGEEWRELRGPLGRAVVKPTGTRSRYFEVSLVTVAQHGPARLAMSTSAGQQAVETVSGGPYIRVNFGPLLVPASGPIRLGFSSIQPRDNARGPRLILSPLQAEYLAPGEWVMNMPALAEFGPGGQRGLYLGAGSRTPFAMTPGVVGRCELEIRSASIGGSVNVTIAVGREARTASVGSKPSVVQIGPFAHARGALSLSVSSPSGESNRGLFISQMRFIPVKRRA